MKLLSLELLKFGPFTGRCLDFSSRMERLHIIFGPNEAGKSTALRAVSGLLFGIPERTPDDHVHSPQELRIGASILSESGEALTVRRRKGRKNTLLDKEEQPIPEERLTRFFPGLSQELFHNLFGLSHDRLSQGGEDLLRGKGSLGQSLFGAGIGLGSLHRLLSNLDGAADKLFTPQGSKRPLNEAINEFTAWRKKSREAAVRPKEWADIAEELEGLRGTLRQADNERKRLQQSMDQLQRIKRTQPILKRRQELLSALQELRNVPRLPVDAAQQRQAAARTIEDGQKALAKLDEEHERNEQELRELFVPKEILQHKDDIEALAEQAPVIKEDLRTRSSLEHSEERLEQEAHGLLQEFGLPGSDLSRIDGFRLSSAAQSRIRKLSNEASGIEAELHNAQGNLDQVERRIVRLERSLEELGPHRDAGPLNRSIKRARQHGDLEAALQAAARRKEHSEQRITLQLRSLELSGSSFASLRSLPLPGDKTIARFIERVEAIAARQAELRRKREELEQELLEVRDRLERLQQEERIPSEDELTLARQGRDGLWEEIKQAWLEGSNPQEQSREETARKLEEAIRTADEISDELRLKARAVAEYVQLTLRSDTIRQRIEQQRAKQRETEEHERSLDAEWREAWAKAGMSPLSPREMADWKARFDHLLEALDAWEQAGAEEQQLRQHIQEMKSTLLSRLQELSPPEVSERDSLQEILDSAESVAEEISRRESSRQSLQKQLEEARLERQEEAGLVRDKKRAYEEWRAQWEEAVSVLDLGGEAGPEEASAKLDTLDKLLKKREELMQTKNRLKEIEAKEALFAKEAEGLAARSAPDLQGLPPLEAVAELKKRCDEAASNKSLSQKLRQRQAEIEAQREERRQEVAEARRHLDGLCQAAGCSRLEDLPLLEEQSERKRALEQELSTLEASLGQEGLELDALNEEAAAYHPDELQPALTEAGERLEELETERERLKDRIKELEQRQRDMEGAGRAAEAEAEAQSALARIDRLVREYARSKMAEVLLQQHMERYRREHQGPILQRAGEIFRDITLGSFHRLLPGFDKNDEMVIMAERPNGQVVAVEGMSDGTRDQLYLSLRLASLEQHLSVNEPLPLIADDLLIRFDDERSKAALRVLAQTAQATQVLFFTHHAKLLELARNALQQSAWLEHVLEAAPPSPQ